MFSTLSVVGILILGQLTKKYIIPKFGKYGFYVFLFIIALIVNGIHVAMTFYPGFGTLVIEAGKFLVSSIGLYELLLNDIVKTPLPPELTDLSAVSTA